MIMSLQFVFKYNLFVSNETERIGRHRICQTTVSLIEGVFLVFCEALNKPTLLGKCFGVSYRAIL